MILRADYGIRILKTSEEGDLMCCRCLPQTKPEQEVDKQEQ